MLIYLLSFHLIAVIAAAVLLVGRLIKLINKSSDHRLRKLFYFSSVALVLSGILLSGFGKLPISTICLESFGLIVAIALADYGIVVFRKRIEAADSTNQKR